jgi:DNA topoisomerase-3
MEIADFKPAKFWKIFGTFAVRGGNYEGVWQKTQKLDGTNPHDRSDRLWTEEAATAVLAEIGDEKIASVVDQKKRSRQTAPRLYDLTSLQREANARHGMPASMTLQIAQALYEKHKCITYPRTDSRALTEDYGETCYKILEAVGDEHRIFARRIIENKAVDGKNRKIFNNKQVSDHFAIVPTQQFPKNLSDAEWKIYHMVLKRFLCVFFPDAEFDVTTRTSTVRDHAFRTEGKVLAVPGWLEVYGKGDGEQGATLPAIGADDGDPPRAKVVEIKSVGDETRPPAPYNEATLLAAMEGAGKLLDDEELAEAMKERGLGTPATRAQIIEHLLALKYLERDGKNLKSTAKAEELFNFLRAIDISTLSSPAMTGEWECKLRQMENGTFARRTFMAEIADLTTAIVEKTKNFTEDKEMAQEVEIISPTDGKPLLEGLRNYRSADGKFSIMKVMAGRKLSLDEVATLLTDKSVGPLDGFRSRAGADFSATLVLDDDFKVTFSFANDQRTEGGVTKPLSQEEIDALEVIGKCPLDGADIVITDGAYVCKQYFAKKCRLRIAKKVLERDIDREQFQKMLTDGKTDLLEGFKSKRTGKLFSARLLLQKDGKIRFQFK